MAASWSVGSISRTTGSNSQRSCSRTAKSNGSTASWATPRSPACRPRRSSFRAHGTACRERELSITTSAFPTLCEFFGTMFRPSPPPRRPAFGWPGRVPRPGGNSDRRRHAGVGSSLHRGRSDFTSAEVLNRIDAKKARFGRHRRYVGNLKTHRKLEWEVPDHQGQRNSRPRSRPWTARRCGSAAVSSGTSRRDGAHRLAYLVERRGSPRGQRTCVGRQRLRHAGAAARQDLRPLLPRTQGASARPVVRPSPAPLRCAAPARWRQRPRWPSSARGEASSPSAGPTRHRSERLRTP